jgi:hypothetical protein
VETLIKSTMCRGSLDRLVAGFLKQRLRGRTHLFRRAVEQIVVRRAVDLVVGLMVKPVQRAVGHAEYNRSRVYQGLCGRGTLGRDPLGELWNFQQPGLQAATPLRGVNLVQLAFQPASELVRALKAKEVNSRELLEMYLERVERYNPLLNAIVHLKADDARQRADEADAALNRGEVCGALHGLPMTIKELFEVEGFRWTAGDSSLFHPTRVSSPASDIVGCRVHRPPVSSCCQGSQYCHPSRRDQCSPRDARVHCSLLA